MANVTVRVSFCAGVLFLSLCSFPACVCMCVCGCVLFTCFRGSSSGPCHPPAKSSPIESLLINSSAPRVVINADCLKLKKPPSRHQIIVSAGGIVLWPLSCLLIPCLCADLSSLWIQASICNSVCAHRLAFSSITSQSVFSLLSKLPVQRVLNFLFSQFYNS